MRCLARQQAYWYLGGATTSAGAPGGGGHRHQYQWGDASRCLQSQPRGWMRVGGLSATCLVALCSACSASASGACRVLAAHAQARDCPCKLRGAGRTGRTAGEGEGVGAAEVLQPGSASTVQTSTGGPCVRLCLRTGRLALARRPPRGFRCDGCDAPLNMAALLHPR